MGTCENRRIANTDMAFQDHHHHHHHLSQELPLHHPNYSDHHHPSVAAASVFRSLLPDHHPSTEDKPPAPPTSTTTWLNSSTLHHQWLSTQSQPSPPTPPDNNDHIQDSAGGGRDNSGSNGNNTNWEREKCKADILNHPLYEQLLSAHVSCLRIATPVDQLPRIDAQLAQSSQVVAKYSVLGHGQQPLDDKDLDNFMTHYVLLLSSFKEQLQQHVRVHAMEAVMACWELEQSLQSLTGVAPGEGTGATMSDDDEDQADSETNLFDESLDGPDSMGFGPLVPTETERSLMERVRQELKHELKQEEDKARLVQETGLQLKQINNWFINQRKRNWHSNPSSSSSQKSKRKRNQPSSFAAFDCSFPVS
ncbi:Homeobox protein knotted-1-like LET12 [Sesamum angolense]|uniref:Homeobox protein knotted-1-like LET12 n=1 Tax=Sesamum angolense TaxID=2727404 RepID=A0AAE1WDR5_9LAMI|nr:Homeobox protein knotted-1-like LET12 [Sesamum angolense]